MTDLVPFSSPRSARIYLYNLPVDMRRSFDGLMAIEQAEIRDREGNLIKRTARVNPGLCMGCGTCVAVCPSKSADLEGFTEQQIYSMVESLV